MSTTVAVTDQLWYKDAVIYQLHIKAFADSNGDGVGDFHGLIGKLDYLAQLGVTAIWVLPFYPSPLRDDGYDIADYDTVNPTYGDLAAFKRFLKEAHRRGLRVITELVINHTSDEHAWFQRARRAPKGSPERNFYVWSDTPEPYGETRIIFEDFETSNWTWDPVAGQYFWHRFYSHQPDLNFDNPAVHRAVFAAMDRWLAMGVDGVRLDAIPYLYEREGTNCENLPETHAFLKQLRARLDAKFPGRMLLAEANQWPEDAVAYFGDGDECNMAFHFPLMPRLYMALEMEDCRPIIDILAQTPEIPENCQWAMFLRNHDELTLEMVTDEERVNMRRAYAPDTRMRINLGIRRRLAPLLQNDRRRIELLNALLFSMPGTPVMYYGDEIGMGDNVYLDDRDGVRTPMQWSPDRNAGFSDANPHQLYLPVITDPQYHYETVNVEAQRANPASLWWWIHDLIAMRRRQPVLGRGGMTFVESDNPRILSFVRSTADDPVQVLVVANLSRHAQQVTLDLSALDGVTPVEMFGDTAFAPITHQPYRLTLAPYGVYWFRLDTAPADPSDPLPPAVHVQISGGTIDLAQRSTRRTVEKALAAWLPTRPWFRASAHKLRDITLRSWVEMGAARRDPAVLTIVDAEFANGDVQAYAVPLAVMRGDRAAYAAATWPERVIAPLDERDALLVDGMVSTDLVRALAQRAWRREPPTGGSLRLDTWRSAKDPKVPVDAELSLLGHDAGTSVSRLGEVVVELRRFLAGGVATDPELAGALTAAGFTGVVPVLARVDAAPGAGEASTLALVRPFVAHDSDGIDVVAERLRTFFDTARATPGEVSQAAVADAFAPLASGELERLYTVYGSALDLAEVIGRLVADLHAALHGVGGAAPLRFTSLYQRSLYQSINGTLRTTVRAMAGTPDELDGTMVARANEHVNGLRGPRLDVVRTQIHGNLHLGRLLWNGSDVVLLDVAGDLTTPVDTRVIKRSPLRDVASMIVSLDEAAHHAARVATTRANAPGPEQFETWADQWLGAVTTVLWDAYRRRLAEARPDAAIIPTGPGEARLMVGLYALETACRRLLAADLRDHASRTTRAAGVRRAIARL